MGREGTQRRPKTREVWRKQGIQKESVVGGSSKDKQGKAGGTYSGTSSCCGALLVRPPCPSGDHSWSLWRASRTRATMPASERLPASFLSEKVPTLPRAWACVEERDNKREKIRAAIIVFGRSFSSNLRLFPAYYIFFFYYFFSEFCCPC